MPGNMKIYTKRGDKGETSLYGGKRVPKDSPRVRAYGGVDELNAFIGMAVVNTNELDLKNHLMKIQEDLHVIGSNLAFPGSVQQSLIKGESVAEKLPRVTGEHVHQLEQWIDHYDEELPELKNFILCGGTEVSAMLHVARNVCRRVERDVVALSREEETDKDLIKYLNRLSDYLFNAARLATKREGKEDIKWIPERSTLAAYMEEEE